MFNFLQNWPLYWHYPELQSRPHLRTGDPEFQLDLALEWLRTAADSSPAGGIPTSFNLRTRRWGQPYRETTGYVIPTLIAYSALRSRPEFFSLATALADWEIKQQDPTGGIGEIRPDGGIALKVFNTGQVILGWCAAFDATHQERYLHAASRAGEWLLIHQDSQTGGWEKFGNGGINGIDSRVAWSLIALSQRTGLTTYQIAAQKFFDWLLKQQTPNGWFAHSSLRDPAKPWTHAIAYTISGLWESGLLLSDNRLIAASLKAARALVEYYESRSETAYLPASFDSGWQSNDRYSCLTGNAQLAIEWQKMARLGQETGFAQAADRMIGQLQRLQFITTNDPCVRGGLPGSHPAGGAYATNSIPNWGVKFFADALLLKLGSPPWLLG